MGGFNYKKILPSREIRLFILKCLSFVPDRTMLKIQYRIKMGRNLNLKNPERYTEKIQWYKLYYKDPTMVKCVDKYDVRQFVEQKGLGCILNECYGVYNSVNEIDFDKLPEQFVVKNTLGGGGTSVIVCEKKETIDIEELKEKLSKWTAKKIQTRDGGREWPYYSGKKPRIIIEKFLEEKGEHGLIDYKFMCFNGKVQYCYVLCDRELGVSVKEGICDRELNLLPACELGDEVPKEIKKPDNYSEMLGIAEKLASEFPHVRVDLYNLDGKIVFGELTFYDGSGYASYNPDEFDFEMGSHFELPKVNA